MGQVIDFNKKKREQKLKKEHDYHSWGSYDPPKSTQDKIDDAMKKFGSHRKNKNNDKESKE